MKVWIFKMINAQTAVRLKLVKEPITITLIEISREILSAEIHEFSK